MAYVAITRKAIEEFLTARRFEAAKRGNELVFIRSHSKCPGLKMLVYTSLAYDGLQARGCGQDAIRCCLIFSHDDGWSRDAGIGKTTRVHRVTSEAGILSRLGDRLQTLAAEASQMLMDPCPHCGAPRYADSGRCVSWKCRKEHPTPARPQAQQTA